MDKRRLRRSAVGDADAQRGQRRVVGILPQTDSSARSADYPDKNMGNQRCVRQERQIVGTTKRLMMALHWMSPDGTSCWEVPRCC